MKKLGSWQQGIYQKLMSGYEVRHPISLLAGGAARWSGKYKESFYSLIAWLEKEGYVIKYIPGVRGGEYTAYWQVMACPNKNYREEI